MGKKREGEWLTPFHRGIHSPPLPRHWLLSASPGTSREVRFKTPQHLPPAVVGGTAASGVPANPLPLTLTSPIFKMLSHQFLMNPGAIIIPALLVLECCCQRERFWKVSRAIEKLVIIYSETSQIWIRREGTWTGLWRTGRGKGFLGRAFRGAEGRWCGHRARSSLPPLYVIVVFWSIVTDIHWKLAIFL